MKTLLAGGTGIARSRSRFEYHTATPAAVAALSSPDKRLSARPTTR